MHEGLLIARGFRVAPILVAEAQLARAILSLIPRVAFEFPDLASDGGSIPCVNIEA